MWAREVGVAMACVGMAFAGACKSTSPMKVDASTDTAVETDATADAIDAALQCTYADGGAPATPDASRAGCPSAGCTAGSVCVEENGAVNTGQACVPIPLECHGTPTCACMATCACIYAVGRLPETCTERPGFILCDNRTRN